MARAEQDVGQKSKKAKPAAPRHITIKEYVSYPPIFAIAAKTLDPMDIVNEAWKGWISKRGIPWGMLPGGIPTLRLSFDCRVLPWPSIKQHSVDGPDNNMRSLAAHAALHSMFPEQKKNDPYEIGQIGYLLSCTDPDCGIPYSPDSMHRGCAVGHGEFCKNLILMYEYTGVEWYKKWAEKALNTLKKYAIIETWPNVGKVAWYPQGSFAPGDPPAKETSDPTMGGWQHLAVGWNTWAFAEWYSVTGDEDALDFAEALANRLMNSCDPNGNDGSLRPDGSFGGNSQKSVASWHMHGHTHCLPGLVLLGEQLIKAGRVEKGLRIINQAHKTFDWLYDPVHNPDAGSITGWLSEWLMVATGWEKQGDCEGCTVGDVVQTAAALGAVAKLDASLAGFVDYYDRAEQIFRGQLVEQRFRLTPAYLAVLKQCLQKKMDKDKQKTRWEDASTAGNHAQARSNQIEQSVETFPRGERDVIRFDGNDYLTLDDSAALRLKRFSIYAVLEVVAGGDPQTYYSNYDNPINWGKGINLSIGPHGSVIFLTTDGTEKNYDPLSPPDVLPEGYHIITVTYDENNKSIYADGVKLVSSKSKGLDYGEKSVAAIGALREFGFLLQSGIAEIIIYDSVDNRQKSAVESYLSDKYGIDTDTPVKDKTFDMGNPVLWLKADNGLQKNTNPKIASEQAQDLDHRYAQAIETAERMVGQQLGLCGFPDWVNKLPSDLDPDLPGIHMQGCCADATIRGANAIWSQTVTGDEEKTRVNMAFNRKSSLVDVVSCLPYRGEIDVKVKTARKVLVRVPQWTLKEKVIAYLQRKPIPVKWDGSYIVFDNVEKDDLLTVTYPLRIAEIKETPGSLDGTEYTEQWRGNTIVDISPPGKWIPIFHRPELDTEEIPQL